MKFSEALSIKPGITAIIGGGGKTSLMMALAEELRGQGRVIVCTTTRIYPPMNLPLYMGKNCGQIASVLRDTPVICLGEMMAEKLGPSTIAVEDMATVADYVLTEADGSMGLPLKAHASFEPVIPRGARVIYVIGADGVGRPIQEAAHRPELYAKALGTDVSHIVTPEDAARLVDYGDTVLFNKAEQPEDIENGRRLGAAFSGTTVIASIRHKNIVDIIKNGSTATPVGI